MLCVIRTPYRPWLLITFFFTMLLWTPASQTPVPKGTPTLSENPAAGMFS